MIISNDDAVTGKYLLMWDRLDVLKRMSAPRAGMICGHP